jgi:hypothetical protein
MGDAFTLAAPEPLKVKARGTKNLARISVIKDGKIVYSVEPKKQQAQFEFTDRNSRKGAHYYYVRVEQDDTMLAWSSPMFVEYK